MEYFFRSNINMNSYYSNLYYWLCFHINHISFLLNSNIFTLLARYFGWLFIQLLPISLMYQK